MQPLALPSGAPEEERGEGRARLSADGPALGKQGSRGRWSAHQARLGGGVAGRRRKGVLGGPGVVGIGGRLLPSVRLSWGPEEAGGGGERERESWLHCLEGWRER